MSFYRQVPMHEGLPFEVRIPNAGTVEVVRQAQSGEGLVEYATNTPTEATLAVVLTTGIKPQHDTCEFGHG